MPTTVESYIQASRGNFLNALDHISVFREVNGFNAKFLAGKLKAFMNSIDSNDTPCAFQECPFDDALPDRAQSLRRR